MLIFLTILAISAIVFGLGYVVDRWITPWRHQKIMDKIIDDIRSGKTTKPQDYHFGISFDSAGFVVTALKKTSGKPISMTWSEIVRIVAFKRDLFSTDCVCLMMLRHDNMGVEVDEEMKGWSEFTQTLPIYLPGCKPWSGWFMEITTPAFAPNETEIFSRHAKQEA
jgi:hypothetical protein